VDGAVSIDVDQVLRHKKSASTAHLFGKTGALPPAGAQVVDRRYVPVWRIQSGSGEEHVVRARPRARRD
jgi:hypothetical protein